MRAVGSLLEGESKAHAADYNAQVAIQNSRLAAAQGQAAVEAQQRDAARKIGAAVANYGASGVQVDSGSPLDVLADSARMSELDRLTIQYNASLKAMGYDLQARMSQLESRSARTSAVLNAVGAGVQGYTMYRGNQPRGGSSGWTSGYDLPMGGSSPIPTFG